MMTRIFLLFLFLIFSSQAWAERLVNVAIYSGEGTEEQYVEAVEKNLILPVGSEYRIVHKRITAEEIKNDQLSDYDVLFFPGGSGSAQARALGSEGAAKVREFAEQDMKLTVGICAGGYLLAQGYNDATREIELINVQVANIDEWERGTGKVHLVCSPGGDIEQLKDLDVKRIHFENGPAFSDGTLEDFEDVNIIFSYAEDPVDEELNPLLPEGYETLAGKAAVVHAEYGEGEVVLFGPHFELTENAGYSMGEMIIELEPDPDWKQYSSETLGKIFMNHRRRDRRHLEEIE